MCKEKVELRYVNPYSKSCKGERVEVGEIYGRRATVILHEVCDSSCSHECKSSGNMTAEEVHLPSYFFPNLCGSEVWYRAAERVPTIGSTRIKPVDLIVRSERGK